jgi:hypothetical protein
MFLLRVQYMVVSGGALSRDTLPIQNQPCLSRITPVPEYIPEHFKPACSNSINSLGNFYFFYFLSMID